MNKQTFMIIVLALLLLQPVVAGISAPHAMGLAESSKTIAQDPGFRLDPSELTEHVPFEINGTADFVSQGWPGAGTPGNPYVISGLNITEDLGVYLISIMNTDASFVIRDCLLNQESAEDAIYLFNTSAARIEYSTITGGIHALEFLNSNNTVVDHSILISSSSYVVYLTYSYDASFTWNEFENDFRGIYGLYANGLSLSYNTYFCSDFYYVNYLFYCNDTTVSYETVVEGYSFRITDSYRISISDYIGAGINVINSESVDIQRVHLYYALSSTNSIVLISNAPGLNIQDSYISGPDTIGVSISSSSNFTFENNVIEDTSSYGISIVSSNNVSFVGNSIDDVGQYGVRFVGSDFLTIDDNELSNTGDIGIYIEDSMNGTVTNNILNHIGDMGVVLYTSHNWSVSDNFLDYIDSGAVYLEEADNITATRNYINYCDAGIVVDGSNRADVIDNHVTRALDTAYVVTSADNTVLAGNTADRVGIGASVDTGLAVVVEGNDFSRVSDTGLSLYDLESSFIRSNTISGTGTIGMDLDLILTSAIEDNDLTGFGFYFEPTRSYLYYNNTVTGNTVNGVPIYYELDVVGADLDADDYAQFFLINCSDVDIHDGTFDHVTIPIELILSPNNDIWNIVASDNRYGVYIDRSENTTILNADIDAGGVGEGVHVRLSDNFLLNESSIVGCRINTADGLFLDRSDYATIENSEFDRNYYGIRADEVVDLLISGNTITNTQSYAISLWDPNTYFVRVLNNEIYNASYGIYHEQGDNVTISGNTIMYAYIWGIWASGSSSSDVNATLNIVTNNENGITFRNNGNSYIMNNTVMWN
ncbi:MAG: right-handed parallel beta-helix repeat-containing protein, partial [Candidatus Thorarchaeota archaeon]